MMTDKEALQTQAHQAEVAKNRRTCHQGCLIFVLVVMATIVYLVAFSTSMWFTLYEQQNGNQLIHFVFCLADLSNFHAAIEFSILKKI